MLKKLIVILLLSAMALNLAACGSQVTPSGKNDLKFAIDQEPASLTLTCIPNSRDSLLEL